MSICQYHPGILGRSLQSTDPGHVEIRIEYCPCAGERTDAEVMEAALGCGTGVPELWIHETGMTGGTPEGPGPLYAVLRTYPPQVPTTAQVVPSPSQGVPLESLPARVAAIEARQREYGMHDPGCPARLVERMNRNGGGPYYLPKPCTCWLSKEPTT